MAGDKIYFSNSNEIHGSENFKNIISSFFKDWFKKNGESVYLPGMKMYSYDFISFTEKDVITKNEKELFQFLMELNNDDFSYNIKIKDVQLYHSFKSTGYAVLIFAGLAMKSIYEKTEFYNYLKSSYLSFCTEQSKLLNDILLNRQTKLIDLITKNESRAKQFGYSKADENHLNFRKPRWLIVKNIKTDTTYRSRPGKDNVESTTYETSYYKVDSKDSANSVLLSSNTSKHSDYFWGPTGDDRSSTSEEVDFKLTRRLLHYGEVDLFQDKDLGFEIQSELIDSLVYLLFLDVNILLSKVESILGFSTNLLNVYSFFEFITRHGDFCICNILTAQGINYPKKFEKIQEFMQDEIYKIIPKDEYVESKIYYITNISPIKKYSDAHDVNISAQLYYKFQPYFQKLEKHLLHDKNI